jgi:multiple sugar transport system substrate-binding protein
VVLNSKETVESVKFMQAFWKDAHDEGGLAWDDSNNNRSFLSGDISASLNGASIYVAALNGADKFKTDKGQPLHTDILHAPLPAGPKGQHGYHTAHNHMVMRYSKNQKGAIEFLRWAHKPENLEKWMVVQKGYAVGTARNWEKHKMWADSGPVMAPFKVAAAGQSRLMGHGGEPDKRAAEAWNKFIVTVMYAQACSGKMSPEDSVKWAAGELGKIYS